MKIYSYLDSGKPVLATRLPTHTQVLTPEVAISSTLSEAGPRPADIPVRADENRRLTEKARALVRAHHSRDASRPAPGPSTRPATSVGRLLICVPGSENQVHSRHGIPTEIHLGSNQSREWDRGWEGPLVRPTDPAHPLSSHQFPIGPAPRPLAYDRTGLSVFFRVEDRFVRRSAPDPGARLQG